MRTTLQRIQLALTAAYTVLYAVNAVAQARAGKKRLAVLWGINSGLSLAALALLCHQYFKDEDDYYYDDEDFDTVESADKPAPAVEAD